MEMAKPEQILETNESQIRTQIVETCRLLYGRNMLAAADGNVSYRLSSQRILMTPSGARKSFLQTEGLAVVAENGDILHGRPSGERAMHLEIYRRCPQARAVVHAHPPYAVAWSLARPGWQELPGDYLSELILGAGRVPIVPYARPTTTDMGQQIAPFLPDCRALILARHGAVCWGESLEEALNGMERLEHSAHILWLAEQVGKPEPLPPDEIEHLKIMRNRLGGKLL